MKASKLNQNIIIAYLLLIQAAVILRNAFNGTHIYLLWFCDFAPLLIVVGLIIKDNQFVKATINITLIGQAAVILGIILFMAAGIKLWDTAELFKEPVIAIIITLLLHLASMLGLILEYNKKPSRIALLYSFIMVLVFYLLTAAFSSPGQNINLVYSSDYILGFTPAYYTLSWPILVFLLVIIPTYYLQKGLYLLSRKKPIKK